jgi:hypothetical protein
MGKFDKHDKKGEKDKKSTKVDERTEGCKKLLTVDYAASEPEFGIKAMKWCLAYEAMKSGKAPVFVREQVQVQAETRVMHPDDVERVELRAWTADDTREMNRRNAEVTKDEAAWKKESNAMCRLIERHLSSNVKEEMKARLSYNECLRQQDCVGLWELYRAVTEQMIKHYAEQWKAELRYERFDPREGTFAKFHNRLVTKFERLRLAQDPVSYEKQVTTLGKAIQGVNALASITTDIFRMKPGEYTAESFPHFSNQISALCSSGLFAPSDRIRKRKVAELRYSDEESMSEVTSDSDDDRSRSSEESCPYSDSGSSGQVEQRARNRGSRRGAASKQKHQKERNVRRKDNKRTDKSAKERSGSPKASTIEQVKTLLLNQQNENRQHAAAVSRRLASLEEGREPAKTSYKDKLTGEKTEFKGGKCWNCGTSGHLVRDCQEKRCLCTICNKTGHMAEFCGQLQERRQRLRVEKSDKSAFFKPGGFRASVKMTKSADLPVAGNFLKEAKTLALNCKPLEEKNDLEPRPEQAKRTVFEREATALEAPRAKAQNWQKVTSRRDKKAKVVAASVMMLRATPVVTGKATEVPGRPDCYQIDGKGTVYRRGTGQKLSPGAEVSASKERQPPTQISRTENAAPPTTTPRKAKLCVDYVDDLEYRMEWPELPTVTAGRSKPSAAGPRDTPRFTPAPARRASASSTAKSTGRSMDTPSAARRSVNRVSNAASGSAQAQSATSLAARSERVYPQRTAEKGGNSPSSGDGNGTDDDGVRKHDADSESEPSATSDSVPDLVGSSDEEFAPRTEPRARPVPAAPVRSVPAAPVRSVPAAPAVQPDAESEPSDEGEMPVNLNSVRNILARQRFTQWTERPLNLTARGNRQSLEAQYLTPTSQMFPSYCEALPFYRELPGPICGAFKYGFRSVDDVRSMYLFTQAPVEFVRHVMNSWKDRLVELMESSFERSVVDLPNSWGKVVDMPASRTVPYLHFLCYECWKGIWDAATDREQQLIRCAVDRNFLHDRLSEEYRSMGGDWTRWQSPAPARKPDGTLRDASDEQPQPNRMSGSMDRTQAEANLPGRYVVSFPMGSNAAPEAYDHSSENPAAATMDLSKQIPTYREDEQRRIGFERVCVFGPADVCMPGMHSLIITTPCYREDPEKLTMMGLSPRRSSDAAEHVPVLTVDSRVADSATAEELNDEVVRQFLLHKMQLVSTAETLGTIGWVTVTSLTRAELFTAYCKAMSEGLALQVIAEWQHTPKITAKLADTLQRLFSWENKNRWRDISALKVPGKVLTSRLSYGCLRADAVHCSGPLAPREKDPTPPTVPTPAQSSSSSAKSHKRAAVEPRAADRAEGESTGKRKTRSGGATLMTYTRKPPRKQIIEPSKFLVLDTGATVSVENSPQNIRQYRRTPGRGMVMTAANGSTMCVDQVGEVRGIGTVAIVRDASDSILSVPQLAKQGCKVTFDHQRALIQSPSCRTPIEARMAGENDHYLLDRSDLAKLTAEPLARKVSDPLPRANRKGGAVSTFAVHTSERTGRGETERTAVAQGNALGEHLEEETVGPAVDEVDAADEPSGPARELSPEQFLRARQVRDLHCVLGHPSDLALKNALRNGLIAGTRLTERDVDHARQSLGPCIACAAGKTVKEHFTHSEREPAASIGERVYGDVYFLAGKNAYENDRALVPVSACRTMLLVVDGYSGMLHIVRMNDKHASSIQKALNYVLAEYTKHGHRMHEFHCDNESVFMACDVWLGSKQKICSENVSELPLCPYRQLFLQIVMTTPDKPD